MILAKSVFAVLLFWELLYLSYLFEKGDSFDF